MPVVKAPLFNVAATVILTIGTTVSMTAFGVLNRLYFAAPAGVDRPAEVKRVAVATHSLAGGELILPVISGPHYQQLAKAVRPLADLQAYDTQSAASVAGKSGRMVVSFVSAGFFKDLGVGIARGRAFSPDEDRWGDPRHVALVSYSFFLNELGSSEATLGQSIRIDTTTYTIVGVLAPGFRGIDADAVDVWAPLSARPLGIEGHWFDDEEMPVLSVVARLHDGIDVKLLEQALTRRYRELRPAEFQDGPNADRVLAMPLAQVWSPELLGGAQSQNLTTTSRLALLAGIVMLITALNVGSMMLMRTVRRTPEIATRVALGLSPRSLASELFMHVAGIAILSTMLGSAASYVAEGRVLWQLFPGLRWPAVPLDPRVIAMAGCVTLVCVSIGTLLPVTYILRQDLNRHLSLGVGGNRGDRRYHIALLGVQTTLSAWLVVTGMLLEKSLHRTSTVDLGFDYRQLITVNVPTAVQAEMVRAAVQRLTVMPGVAAVAASQSDVRPGVMTGAFRITGDSTSSPDIIPSFNVVEPSYFKALGLRVIEGRAFTEQDASGSEPVTVVTERMARAYWPNHSAVGQCFYALWPADACRRIVGVIKDLRFDLRAGPPAHFLLPTAQTTSTERSAISIRVDTGSGAPDVNVIRRIVDPLLSNATQRPLVRSGPGRLEPQIRPIRTAAFLFTLCGLIAIVSASIGVFSLVSYGIIQRTKELAIKIAIGAAAPRILREVMSAAVPPVLIGTTIGLILAVITARSSSALLFETKAFDLGAALASLAVVTVVAGSAAALAGNRVFAIDPASAMKSQ